MTDHSDESVIAYVDGRMERAERTAFEARLAKDAVLSDRVAAHRWLTRQLVAAYPVPTGQDDDRDLAGRFGLHDDNVIPILAHRQPRTPRDWAWMGGAMAASLVLGLLVGQFRSASVDPLVAFREGRPIASGALAETLSNRFSGETGAIRIALTFRTKTGVCRAFQVAQGVGGVACREGSNWNMAIMETIKTDSGDTTEYRLAGGNLSPSLMARVDQMIMGEPLGPLDETTFIKSGW